MDDHLFVFLSVSCFFSLSSASHHWIVTESGRIEAKDRMQSGFPLARSYDLIAFLDQYERALMEAELNATLQDYKRIVDQHWDAIEEESTFEKRLLLTDPDCLFAEHTLQDFRSNPAFLDFRNGQRPILPDHRHDEEPPDCRKYLRLEFSMLTYPHLSTMRVWGNLTQLLDEIVTETEEHLDVAAMLDKDFSDWTAYNLAANYWQMRGNASHAVECLRLAIFFAPKHRRNLPLMNLGSLMIAGRRFDEAKIVTQAAIDYDENEYRAYVAMGFLHTLTGEFDEAAEYYQKAHSLREDMPFLSKYRAAILCHKRLMDGLKAIEGALKFLIKEMEDFNALHQKWLMTMSHISAERACSEHSPPPPTTTRMFSIMRAVESKTFRLTQRLAHAMPKPDRRDLQVEGSCKSVSSTEPMDVSMQCSSKELDASSRATDIKLLTKVRQFMNFMADFDEILVNPETRQINGKLIEQLVRIENGFHGKQPRNSKFWKILDSCKHMTSFQDSVTECGHHIFSKYFLDMQAAKEYQEELLDESTIENYVHDRYMAGFHDLNDY